MISVYDLDKVLDKLGYDGDRTVATEQAMQITQEEYENTEMVNSHDWNTILDEIENYTPEKLLEALRTERNFRLSQTDFYALSDVTISDEMVTYRQALRDITETYTSLDDVVWPEKPGE